ncbi:YceH family protein [Pseudoalteromonas xiamenensis]|uniref:YceH family protein n=1 Tax=Pseudoalteromonas xiamenensis TaxID=882626 RepID=UPI0035E68D2D
MELNQLEQRILGCLIEKSITTPDIYPLSLNALTTACNQKTNREPVLSVSEQAVLDTLDGLIDQRLVVVESVGSRVQKYRQRLCQGEFAKLTLTTQQVAILCLLFLRGAQTPGELRTRSTRLAEFKDVQQVENELNNLISAGHVQLLDKAPGQREARYAHTLSSDVYIGSSEMPTTGHTEISSTHEIEALLREIEEVKAELRQIKQHLGL